MPIERSYATLKISFALVTNRKCGNVWIGPNMASLGCKAILRNWTNYGDLTQSVEQNNGGKEARWKMSGWHDQSLSVDQLWRAWVVWWGKNAYIHGNLTRSVGHENEFRVKWQMSDWEVPSIIIVYTKYGQHSWCGNGETGPIAKNWRR